MTWWELAACKGMALSIFYAPEAAERRRQVVKGYYNAAALVCEGCPVADACLADALATEREVGLAYGFRGGLPPDARRDLLYPKRKNRKRRT